MIGINTVVISYSKSIRVSQIWMKMNLLAQISHSITIALVVSTSCCIECIPTDSREKTESLVRCKSIPEMLNYLYRLLGDHLSVSEKCKRYALILSITASGLSLFEPTIDHLSALTQETVDEHYSKMGAKRLSALYMSAIDRYRTSQLGPPFLELIECLRQLDGRVLDKYLDDKELQMIIYLYRQALESTDKRIDLDEFDLGQLSSAFRASLNQILRGHLKSRLCIASREVRQTFENLTSTRTELPMAIESNQGADASDTGPSPSVHLPQKGRKISDTLRIKKNLQRAQLRLSKLLQGATEQQGSPELTASIEYSKALRRRKPRKADEWDLEKRRRRKLVRDKERSRKLRQENPDHYRELARLGQRRRRLLESTDLDSPEEVRQERQKQLRQRRLEQQAHYRSHLKHVQRQQQDLQAQIEQFVSGRLSPNMLTWPELDPLVSYTHPQLQLEQPQLRPSQATLDSSITDLLAQLPPEQMNFGMKQAIVKPTVVCPRTFSSLDCGQIDSAHNRTDFERGGRTVDNSRTCLSVPPRQGEYSVEEFQAHAVHRADDDDCESVDIEALLFQSPSPVGVPLELDTFDRLHEYDR